MGFEIKFNWALQIEPPTKLEAGKEYAFSKKGNRVFPIKTPIDMIHPDRTAIAKVQILEFKNTDGLTTGKFKVIKIYSGQEKKILSAYWKENK